MINSAACVTLFSQILLTGDPSHLSASQYDAAAVTENDLSPLRAFAESHHVVLRAFPALKDATSAAGNLRAADWLGEAIESEKARIDRALSFLEPICDALTDVGPVVVIKSLDHWPDLGSDLDLFSDAEAADVVAIMSRRFQAKVADRSWGDRLANKWNFIVPGLPELVEVHVQRLGQTGEQTAIAKSVVVRAREVNLNGRRFRTTSPEDRFVISTLQRMYRHFYIRLCDVVDNAGLMQTNAIDYSYLQALSQSAGIWTGVATYLTVISDYVKSYRGEGISLSQEVTSEARFRGDKVSFRDNFLRIPILPYSAGLYAAELGHLLFSGELRNTLRLSLLPGLATAAALEYKLTGSDKGIW